MPDQPAKHSVPKAPAYPLYVHGEDEMLRFDLAIAVAAEMLHADPNNLEARSAAKEIYEIDITTG